MATKTFQASNVIPFPKHMIGVKRQSDGSRSAALTGRQEWSLAVFAGDDGMTSIDARMPTGVAYKIVAMLATTLSMAGPLCGE